MPADFQTPARILRSFVSLALFAIFWLAPTVTILAAEKPRTFVSGDGRKLKAALLGVEDGNARLVLESGRAVSLPISRFSENDQKYINGWWEKRKNLPRLTELTTVVKKSESFRRDGDKRITDTSYLVTVRNNSSRKISNVELDCHVYWKIAERGFTRMEDHGGGVAVVESIEPKGSHQHTLGPFIATDVIKVRGARRSEKIIGVSVSALVDGILHSTTEFPSRVATEFKKYSDRREGIDEDIEERQKQLDKQDAERAGK